MQQKNDSNSQTSQRSRHHSEAVVMRGFWVYPGLSVVTMVGMAREDESRMSPGPLPSPRSSHLSADAGQSPVPARQLQPTLRAICPFVHLYLDQCTWKIIIEFLRRSWKWQHYCEGVTFRWQWKRHPGAELFAVSFIHAWHFAQCEICDGVWSYAGITGLCDAEKILCKHRMFIYPKAL